MCTRGDADNYRVRTMEEFKKLDPNDAEDSACSSEQADHLTASMLSAESASAGPCSNQALRGSAGACRRGEPA